MDKLQAEEAAAAARIQRKYRQKSKEWRRLEESEAWLYRNQREWQEQAKRDQQAQILGEGQKMDSAVRNIQRAYRGMLWSRREEAKAKQSIGLRAAQPKPPKVPRPPPRPQ